MLVAPVRTGSVESITQTIGISAGGKPLEVVIRGRSDARCRALVIAAQHGDEPIAREAAQQVASTWLPPDDLAVATVACVNPDGLAGDRRENADGADLNRDHQRLESPEIRALHAFARAFRPGLVVDVHTFKPRRKALLDDSGIEWGADVMLEIDNHPGRLVEYPARWSALMKPVMEALDRQSVRCDRYLLWRPSGRIRTSSADLVDARNGLSSRVGATGVLIEGREPSRRYGSAARTRTCLVHAIKMVLDRWADMGEESPAFESDVLHLDAERPAGTTATAYTLSKFESVPARRVLPGRSFTNLLPSRPVLMPLAYGVPARCTALRALLDRHGFEPADAWQVRRRLGAEEIGMVTHGHPSKNPDRAVRSPVVEWSCQEPRIVDRVYYFTDQPGGDRLAAFLEPGSRFGLHRYADLGIPIVLNQYYAIARGLRSG